MALDVRHDDLAADRRAVPLVVRVHRHRDVRQDRGRADRGDGDAVPAVAVHERIADREEGVVHLDVLDLEVRDRGLVEGAPVDDPVVAIDPAPLPQPHEEGHHRADVVVVHREPLARVVERGAEAAILAHDGAAGPLEPLPGALDERLAAEILPGEPLARELVLDDVLRGDARVVVARLPERVVAPHAMPADEDVLKRAVERMAHVQLAGDVRGRDADRVGPVATRAGSGGVEPLFLPCVLPARLDALGPVERFHGGGV
jgi:hypothetical protein